MRKCVCAHSESEKRRKKKKKWRPVYVHETCAGRKTDLNERLCVYTYVCVARFSLSLSGDCLCVRGSVIHTHARLHTRVEAIGRVCACMRVCITHS